MSLSNLKELVMERKPGMLQSMGLQRSDMTEQLNWTELILLLLLKYYIIFTLNAKNKQYEEKNIFSLTFTIKMVWFVLQTWVLLYKREHLMAQVDQGVI